MNHEKHDRQLRKKFESYAPSVDESDMWASIEAELPQKKSKRRYLLFFFLLIGVGSIGVSTYYSFNKDTADLASSENSKSTFERNLSDNKNSSFISKNILKNKENNPTTKLPNANKPEKSTVFKKAKQRNIITPLSNQGTTENQKEYKILNRVQSENTDLTAPIKINERAPTPQLQYLAYLPTKVIIQKIDNEPNLDKFLKPIIPIKPKTTKISKWHLGLMASAGKSFSDYSEPIEQTEMGLEALSSQLDIQYNLNNHWSLGLGVAYLYSVSNSQVQTISEVTSINQDTLAITHTSNGTEFTIGPREFSTRTRASHLRHQRSQQIFLPLTLRYTDAISDTWNLQLGLGYGIGLWSDITGVIQDRDNTSYDLGTDIENRLRVRGSERIIMESYLTRKIEKIGYARLGAQYLFDLNGRYNGNFRIQKRSDAIQLSIGISIPLNF